MAKFKSFQLVSRVTGYFNAERTYPKPHHGALNSGYLNAKNLDAPCRTTPLPTGKGLDYSPGSGPQSRGAKQNWRLMKTEQTLLEFMCETRDLLERLINEMQQSATDNFNRVHGEPVGLEPKNQIPLFETTTDNVNEMLTACFKYHTAQSTIGFLKSLETYFLNYRTLTPKQLISLKSLYESTPESKTGMRP